MVLWLTGELAIHGMKVLGEDSAIRVSSSSSSSPTRCREGVPYCDEPRYELL